MKVRIPIEMTARRRDAALYDAAVERRAEEIAQARVNEAIATTAKLTLLVVANLLVEEHGWGVGENATRLPQLLRRVEETIIRDGERYDYDCVLTAQEARARANGFEVSL